MLLMLLLKYFQRKYYFLELGTLPTLIVDRLSKEKLHNGIFVGPDIRRLFLNDHFCLLLNDTQKSAFYWLKKTVVDVLYGSTTSFMEQEQIVNELINSFYEMGCNYSPKMHYIHCHLSSLIENKTSVHDEHGERMHQCVKLFETRYDGKTLKNMIADFIWTYHK